jgi:hypothetical protein
MDGAPIIPSTPGAPLSGEEERRPSVGGLFGLDVQAQSP